MDTLTPIRSKFELFKEQLDRITPILQRMQDDPVFLEKERHRYDNVKIQSTADMTRLATPGTLSPEKPYDELLSTQEIYWIKRRVPISNPVARYNIETLQEKDRVWRESSKRDENDNPIYRGPNLIGRAGRLRLSVMTRHSIKKRWERLGVWNSEWDIPSHLYSNDTRHPWIWNFEGKGPRGKRKYDQLPFREQETSWPARNEENCYERAIRVHLEQKGSWNNNFHSVSSGTDQPLNIQMDDRAAFLIGRPWCVWIFDVEEENTRLERNRKLLFQERLLFSKENVRARWKEKGFWKESWGDLPGWKWRHESPSPEPPDINDMDFTPSEIDALERIQEKQRQPVHPIRHKPQPPNDLSKIFTRHRESGGEEETVMDALAVNEDALPYRAGSGVEDIMTDPPASNASLSPPGAGARRTSLSDDLVGSSGPKARKTEDASRTLTQPSGVFKSIPVPRRSARIAEKKQKLDAARAVAEVFKLPKGGRAAPLRAPPSPPQRREQEQHQQEQHQLEKRTATRASTGRNGPSEKETAKTQEIPEQATRRRKGSSFAKMTSKPQGTAKQRGRPGGKK